MLQTNAGLSFVSGYQLPLAAIGNTNGALRIHSVSTGRKKYISNLHQFRQRSDITLFILATLESETFELKNIVPVKITELSDGEFLASFEEAGISITGDTPQDAIRHFKNELIETFEIYKREQLGVVPKKQLAILEKYIGKKGRQ